MEASNKKASVVAKFLNLHTHPNGGFYLETLRDSSVTLSKSQLPPRYKVDRPISTCIYFLLPSGSVSHLHRIPCAQTWHFYMGEPLTVFEMCQDGQFKQTILGTDIDAGQLPQYTVQPFVWFGSYPTLDIESYSSDGSSLVKAPARDPESHYSLVGCTCAPGFQFDDFELTSHTQIASLAPSAEPFLRYLTPSN